MAFTLSHVIPVLTGSHRLLTPVLAGPRGALTPTTIGFGVLPPGVVPRVALCVRSLDTTSSYTGM